MVSAIEASTTERPSRTPEGAGDMQGRDAVLSSLASLPATRGWRICAGVMLALSVAAFIAIVPFAKSPLAPMAAFVPLYQSALVVNDLITALLLFGQFNILRKRALLTLGAGYLFCAGMAVAHALSFPGLFAPQGVIGGGAQTTAWLYFLWHGGFPLFVIGYALSMNRTAGAHVLSPTRTVVRTSVVAALGAIAVTATAVLLTTAGHDALPVIMSGNTDASSKFAVACGTWALSLVALIAVYRRQSMTVLDLWLCVTLCVWLFDIALAAVFNGARFDLGFYAGRVYGLGASMFVLAVLLLENGRLYARLADAHWAEQNAKRLAEDATRMKSQFLANMSHEIRTPLNAILGMTRLVLKTELTAQQSEFMNKISRGGQHLLGIVNDLLDFSKLEAGKLDVEHVEFELDQVLANITELLADKSSAKGLELVVSVDDAVPNYLVGDPLRIGQILLNYANNAIKFTASGEVAILVRVAEERDNSLLLHCSVRDTGIGLTADQRARLFRSFEQADTSITRRYGGTGLGLVIARNLAELMGGEAGVDSEHGKGACFWFTAGVGKSVRQPRTLIPSAELRGKRVLVVDDNASARVTMGHMLRTMKFDVTQCDSGAGALEALREANAQRRGYEVVALDWQMPAMDGIEAARRINAMALFTRPTLLLVTAHHREEAIRGASAAGFDGVLVKPINPSMMFDTLMSALHRRERRELHGIPRLAQPEAPAASPAAGGCARILLVEDNELNQEVAVGLLNYGGIQVDVAVNGAQAIEMLRAAADRTYCAVLMDMQMPVMDGLTATRRLRQEPRFRDLPIIAMTANAMQRDREACLEAGMTAHLAKPVDEGLLWATLARCVPELAQRPAQRSALPANPVAASSGFPVIDGLDSADGLRRLLGNTAKYASFLRRFTDSQRGAVEAIRTALAQGDRTQARIVAHTLKGLAGTIGAYPLQKAAAAVESLLSEPVSPAAALDAAVSALAAHLNPLTQALEALPSPIEPPLPAAPGDPETVEQTCERLDTLLAAGDSEAVEAFDASAACLRGAAPAQFETLAAAIRGFDFDAARIAVRAIRDASTPARAPGTQATQQFQEIVT